MNTGDMVTHKFNEKWTRGKVFSFLQEEPNAVMILWANGDIEKAFIEDLELLGWNLHK